MNDKPRLIDANALKKELDAWASPIRNRKFYVRDDAICVIDAMPAIDAVPVVHGKWILVDEHTAACSACGDCVDDDSPFCPNCGAKMGGKDGNINGS